MVARRKNKIKTSLGTKVFDALNIIMMCFLMIITVYPFWYTVVLSFSDPDMMTGLALLPKGFNWGAYKLLLEYDLLWTGYANTIIRCILGVGISLFFTTLVAYPLSKKELPFNKIFTAFILFTMMFGGGLIPSYMLIKGLGMLNTVWALVLPGMISAYNVFIVRNFFKSIPDSLEEAAIIDGAGWFGVWVRVILPLSKPVLATVGLWILVGHWNAWFDAMIYITDPKKSVLQVILRKISIENDTTSINAIINSVNNTNNAFTGKTLEAAMIVAAMIPMLIIYPFIQKYFAKGVMIGSVKG